MKGTFMLLLIFPAYHHCSIGKALFLCILTCILLQSFVVKYIISNNKCFNFTVCIVIYSTEKIKRDIVLNLLHWITRE